MSAWRIMVLLAALGIAALLGPQLSPAELDPKAHQTISEATYHRLFKEYVCRALHKSEADVVVTRLEVIGNKLLPQGRVDFQVFDNHNSRLKGDVRLTVLASVSGFAAVRVEVRGWVDVSEEVVCTPREMKRGEVLSPDSLYVTRRNATYLSDDMVTDKNDVSGMVLRHQIAAGTCLKTWMVERRTVVNKGDLVMILAESDSMRITAPGEALQDGHLGEMVRVRNRMSKKVIYARIEGDSMVRVIF